MAKFLAVHPVGKEATLEAITPDATSLKASLTVDAYWIRSWYAREEGKIYCLWDARDVKSIRQVFAQGAPEFPIEGIYELELMINSEDFR